MKLLRSQFSSGFAPNSRVAQRGCLFYIATFMAWFVSAGCADRGVSSGIAGYNHMTTFAIQEFSVNGALGMNVDVGSGGGESCCILLPRAWRRGMKVTVEWAYDKSEDNPNPLPPPQRIEVEVPMYKPPATLQVHFYTDNRIKLVVSPCSPEHPFYPMSAEDLLPWHAFVTKAAMVESSKRGGGSVEC